MFFFYDIAYINYIISGKLEKVFELNEKYKPKMIWGHPTVLTILADYIIEKKHNPLEIPLIGTYGEKIHDHNRMILNKAFNTRFFEYYGNRENAIAAWGDSNGEFYEVSEYCHLEPQSDPENSQKDRNVPIISTSLHNYAVPMIRYDTGDIITWLGYKSGSSSYPALELAGGRGKDLLLSSGGLMAPYIPPELDSLKHSKIKQYQLEQVEMDKLVLRIVPLESYDKATDESFLVKAFEKALLGRFKITVEYVEEILFTEGGKYRIAVSPLAKEYLKERYTT
jgi:phenylacetate-CoA ligase